MTRKIIQQPSMKNEKGMYLRDEPGQAPTPKVTEVPLSEISIEELIDNGLLALYREVKNILVQSAHGKLDPATARDLRDHLKLLFELKDRENELLNRLTDEELDTVKASLDESK